MSPAAFVWLTNGLMAVVVVCLWIGKRRERRKAEEDAAAMRGRHYVDRANWTSVGRP